MTKQMITTARPSGMPSHTVGIEKPSSSLGHSESFEEGMRLLPEISHENNNPS